MKTRKILTTKEVGIVCLSIGAIALSMVFIGYKFGTGEFAFKPEADGTLSGVDLQTGYSTIASYFDGNFNETQTVSAGIGGMIDSLHDENSYFLTPEAYKELVAVNSGEHFGLGIMYIYRNNELRITEVLPKSPAAEKGVVSHSIIRAINQIPIDKISSQTEAAALFAETDIVTIEIQPPSKESTTLTIEKRFFTSPNLIYKTLNNNTAYIKIYQFSPELEKEFEPIAAQLKTDIPIKIIVDLRNNLGGQTDQAIFLVNQFLSKGTIIEERFKAPGRNEIYRATGDAPFANIKLVVLVNKETSSAAEVFAAAIKENKRGIIIGEKTYGKGTIGQFFELPNGAAMHLTIGEWLTPQGKYIHKVGITPNNTIPDTFENGIDAILHQAEKV